MTAWEILEHFLWDHKIQFEMEKKGYTVSRMHLQTILRFILCTLYSEFTKSFQQRSDLFGQIGQCGLEGVLPVKHRV